MTSLRSLEVVSNHSRGIRRVIRVAQLRKSRISVTVTIPMVVVPLSLVLLELVLEVDLLNIEPLLSRDWVWCAFIMEMPTVVLIAVGVVSALGVLRVTKMLYAERTQIVR